MLGGGERRGAWASLVVVIDVHAHLCARVQMLSGGFNAAEIEGVLKQFPVTVGGGKIKLSLHEVMSKGCVSDLVRICEDFSRN